MVQHSQFDRIIDSEWMMLSYHAVRFNAPGPAPGTHFRLGRMEVEIKTRLDGETNSKPSDWRPSELATVLLVVAKYGCQWMVKEWTGVSAFNVR